MSLLLQHEKNIETAVVNFLGNNQITANYGRELVDLTSNSISVIFEYGGATEDGRQNRAGRLEYNTHEGILQILVNTYRDANQAHNERLGKIRALMLNGNNGLQVSGYGFLDIKPEASTTNELGESNQDSTTLQFTIIYEIDLNGV